MEEGECPDSGAGGGGDEATELMKEEMRRRIRGEGRY